MSRRCSHLQPHSHRPAPPLAPACIFSRPVCNRVCPGGDVPPSSCRSSRAAPPRAPRRTSGWHRCCGRRVRGCVFEGAGLCLLLILVRRLACKLKRYFDMDPQNFLAGVASRSYHPWAGGHARARRARGTARQPGIVAVAWPLMREAMRRERSSSVPPGVACTSTHRNDAPVAQCDSWCDLRSSRRHCSWCKCRGCSGCRDYKPPP